jgi:hypothetical protein
VAELALLACVITQHQLGNNAALRHRHEECELKALLIVEASGVVIHSWKSDENDVL